MSINHNANAGEIAFRYLNIVLKDVSPRDFKIIFSDNESKNNELTEKWDSYCDYGEIKELVHRATYVVLKDTNGALIVKDGDNKFLLVRQSNYTVELAKKYKGYGKGVYDITYDNKLVDLSDDFWIYYADQDPEAGPVENSGVCSYYDSFKKTVNDLGGLLSLVPNEAIKSSAMVLNVPEIVDKEKSPEEYKRVVSNANTFYKDLIRGYPVIADKNMDIGQLGHNNDLIYRCIELLNENISTYSRIPMSMLREQKTGGLNSMGAANNDKGNYVKLITGIQKITRRIWLHIVTKFLYDIGDDLLGRLHEVKVIPPNVYKVDVEKQIETLKSIHEIRTFDVENRDFYDRLYTHEAKKLAENLD